MDRVTALLENSVISSMMQKVESGTSLTREDIRQASTLQSLQLARIGELFVLDIAEREKVLNDELTEFAKRITNG